MKSKTVFVCQQCGQKQSKWMGRCSDCGEWNSLVEEKDTPTPRRGGTLALEREAPQPISSVTVERLQRLPCGISELDNVLGGGLVPGSVVLLGGEPGIGKSTLLLQAAEFYARSGLRILYVSGEESASQIALRASRLEVSSPELFVVSETSLEAISGHMEKLKPGLIIIDSIQTVYSTELGSQPGSVGQLRECTFELTSLAKAAGTPLFLVGHVTKEGSIAGPKVLEHMVDVVLYFEGTASQSFRLLRSIKNRYGSTNELGVFEMIGTGLKSVSNPSELFLSERPTSLPGSVISATLEGTRPILIEVQALASHTSLAIPRRTSIGLDPNRVSLLVAILEKRGGYRFFDQDIFVNIAGGLKISEPAIDLSVLAALMSSYSGKPSPTQSVFFGEVGLGGEIRTVPKAALRLKEAERIGLKRAFVPKRIVDEIKECKNMELVAVEHVQQLSDFV